LHLKQLELEQVPQLFGQITQVLLTIFSVPVGQ